MAFEPFDQRKTHVNHEEFSVFFNIMDCMVKNTLTNISWIKGANYTTTGSNDEHLSKPASTTVNFGNTN